MAAIHPVPISFKGTSIKFQAKKKMQRKKLLSVLKETENEDEVIISSKPKFT